MLTIPRARRRCSRDRRNERLSARLFRLGLSGLAGGAIGRRHRLLGRLLRAVVGAIAGLAVGRGRRSSRRRRERLGRVAVLIEEGDHGGAVLGGAEARGGTLA